MRKFKSTNYLLPLFIILISFCTIASAQKLPKVQVASVRAPQNIKIDGKTTEWNDKFQAYNWGQHIYYTLCNDDDNLYLTARMDDVIGSRKIFKGGLTFTITPTVKTADGLSITFPVISPQRTGEMEHEEGGPLYIYRRLKPNATANKAKIDSLVSSANNKIMKIYKEIYITGIPSITDTLTSIYNTQGIMVGAGFDKKMNYTYELAIPLKYLETALSDVKSFKYNVKLRTLPIIEIKRSAQSLRQPTVILGRFIGPGSLDDQFLFSTTNFSGEYTLALK